MGQGISAVGGSGGIAGSASKLMANVALDALPQAMQNAGIQPSAGTQNAMQQLRGDINGNQKSAAQQAQPGGQAGGPQGAQDPQGAQGSQAPQGSSGGDQQQGIMKMVMELLKMVMQMLQQMQQQQGQSGSGSPQSNPAASGMAGQLPNPGGYANAGTPGGFAAAGASGSDPAASGADDTSGGM